MQITINTDTLAATLTGTPIPKAGGMLPLEFYFQDTSGNPVTLTEGYLVEFGMRLAAAPSSGILTYANQFSAASGNSYAGFVNLADARLMGAIVGNPLLNVVAEVAWTVGGKRFISSNVSFAVQPPIIAGGSTAPNGDGYYYVTPYLRFSPGSPPQEQTLQNGEWVTVTEIS